MPLYTISTQEGMLSSDAKTALAAEITEFHCALSGVDKAFVKIIFNNFPHGDGFVGGAVASATSLTVLIRTGRSPEYKAAMATRLWTMLQRATGAPDAAMVVGIQEVPPSQAMEMGKIMPEVAANSNS
jgi:phenylpyruvate tautomerase PptA (4-oxalocrotonate tautomerase family)